MKFFNGRIALKLFVAIIVLGISCSSWAQRWRYMSIIDSRTDFVIQKDPDKASMGHLVLDAKFCSPDSEFICFDAYGIKFSIPKKFKLSEMKQSWTYGGHSFTAVVQREPWTIFGQEMQIFHIDSVTQNPKIRFYYSNERGLVGLKPIGDRYKILLILEQACGFAAPANCEIQSTLDRKEK